MMQILMTTKTMGLLFIVFTAGFTLGAFVVGAWKDRRRRAEEDRRVEEECKREPQLPSPQPTKRRKASAASAKKKKKKTKRIFTKTAFHRHRDAAEECEEMETSEKETITLSDKESSNRSELSGSETTVSSGYPTFYSSSPSMKSDGQEEPRTSGVDYYSQLGMDEEQKKKFAAFKAKLKLPDNAPVDGVHDDITCYQFLVARKWVVKAAVRMYKNMRKWRKEEKISHIKEWMEANKEKVEIIHSMYPTTLSGFDKEGQPVVYRGVGPIDPSKFLEKVTIEDNSKCETSFLESVQKLAIEQTKKLKKPIFRITAVLDMSNLSTTHRKLLPYFKEWAKIANARYPELIHKIHLVHCPWMFPALFTLVKPFMDSVTRSKIEVHTKGYKSALLQDIDAKSLNVRYGGENTATLAHVTEEGYQPGDSEIKRCLKDKSEREGSESESDRMNKPGESVRSEESEHSEVAQRVADKGSRMLNALEHKLPCGGEDCTVCGNIKP